MHCRCWVYYFDADGNLLSGESIDLTGSLHKEPEYGGYDEDELFERLKERIGFVPGMIHVHEFDAERVMQNCYTRLYKFDGTPRQFIDFADDLDYEHFEGRESRIEYVRGFLREGGFLP